jgi:hypothetical protein
VRNPKEEMIWERMLCGLERRKVGRKYETSVERERERREEEAALKYNI